jgi:hypothetical protein
VRQSEQTAKTILLRWSDAVGEQFGTAGWKTVRRKPFDKKCPMEHMIGSSYAKNISRADDWTG